MSDNITISPSNLTFLWHSCKKCFYNHHVYKNRRPMTMPLVGKMASLSEESFVEKNSNEIDESIQSGKIISTQKSLKSIVETESSKATYTNGILDLVLTKKESEKPKGTKVKVD